MVEAYDAIGVWKGPIAGVAKAVEAGTICNIPGFGGIKEARATLESAGHALAYSSGQYVFNQTGRAFDATDRKMAEKLSKFSTFTSPEEFRGRIRQLIRLTNARVKEYGGRELLPENPDTFMAEIRQRVNVKKHLGDAGIRSITQVQ